MRRFVLAPRTPALHHPFIGWTVWNLYAATTLATKCQSSSRHLGESPLRSLPILCYREWWLDALISTASRSRSLHLALPLSTPFCAISDPTFEKNRTTRTTTGIYLTSCHALYIFKCPPPPPLHHPHLLSSFATRLCLSPYTLSETGAAKWLTFTASQWACWLVSIIYVINTPLSTYYHSLSLYSLLFLFLFLFFLPRLRLHFIPPISLWFGLLGTAAMTYHPRGVDWILLSIQYPHCTQYISILLFCTNPHDSKIPNWIRLYQPCKVVHVQCPSSWGDEVCEGPPPPRQ